MKSLLFYALILSVVLLGACSPTPLSDASRQATIEVTDAWLRPAPGNDSMGSNGALFLVIRNHGSSPDRLLQIETQAAHMAELHLTEVDANGVASMHPVDFIEIPAGGSVELKSGSYHGMLMGLADGVREGSTVTFTLIFEKAGEVVVEVQVKESDQ